MWAADAHVRALGSLFRVRADSEAVGDEVWRLLRTFAARPAPVPGRRDLALVSASARADGQHCLFVDGVPVLAASSWPPLLASLLAEINRLAIDAARGFAVHAGVVASSGGHALALPGPSGAGKSTLTAACLAAGFEYVSDEALCIDYGSGLVASYAKPLALDAGALALLGRTTPGPADRGHEQASAEWLIPPADLGAVVAPEPLHLAQIVLFERRAGACQLERLPAADGMAALLQHSFNHYRRPLDAFTLASQVARRAATWRLGAGDPGEAGRLLFRQFAHPDTQVDAAGTA